MNDFETGKSRLSFCRRTRRDTDMLALYVLAAIVFVLLTPWLGIEFTALAGLLFIGSCWLINSWK